MPTAAEENAAAHADKITAAYARCLWACDRCVTLGASSQGQDEVGGASKLGSFIDSVDSEHTGDYWGWADAGITTDFHDALLPHLVITIWWVRACLYYTSRHVNVKR